MPRRLQFSALRKVRVVELARVVGGLRRDAGVRWWDDACYHLGASLAYYALFSLFPLLLLCVTAFGFALGDGTTVRERVLESVAHGTSPGIRTLIDETLKSMQDHRMARGVGLAVGALTLFLGASGVFSELEGSLNTIWRVQAAPSKTFWQVVLGAAKDKAFSFVVVVVAAGALFVSMVLRTSIDVVAARSVDIKALWSVAETVISSGLLALLLAAMYRMVPQAPVAWRDVIGAAVLTSVLFTGLRGLLSWYLSHLGSYSAYGAVGGVLGLLTWIYVAALIIFYGAEFSRVYAEQFGSLASAKRAPTRSSATSGPITPSSRNQKSATGTRLAH
jgi:membrane protein